MMVTPRFRAPKNGQDDQAATQLGDDVLDLMAKIGLQVEPWQAEVIRALFAAYDPNRSGERP